MGAFSSFLFYYSFVIKMKSISYYLVRFLILLSISLVVLTILDVVTTPKKRETNELGYLNKKIRPLIVSHRGSRYLAPENTKVAYDAALHFGADVLEIDVRKTTDGELVLFHNKDLERTTNKKGIVEEQSLKEMKELDLGYWYNPSAT